MHLYLQQLLTDIREAEKNLSWPYPQKELYDLSDWLSPDEDDAAAPVRMLDQWTGIEHEMLPPENRLTELELHELLEALKDLLKACNCHFVLQTSVPERLQYEAIRQNWSQEVRVRQWHDGFFEMCKPDTPMGTCALGEHCQCAFYEELFKDRIVEDLTPEEARARELEIEIQYLKSKHGDEWMKYYPYHLDKNYDDENGNPHNYGIEREDDDPDDWWKK